MNTASPSSKRILIGAGSFVDARGALLLAERLAKTLAAEVGGILVEETIIAEIADLPGQRVITSSGALVMAPSRQQVRTLLESDAIAFRRSLSALAWARKWSFERQSGELISGLCNAARGWDLLLLGHRETHRRKGDVVLIAPHPDAPQEASSLAEELARSLGAHVIRLTPDVRNPDAAIERSDFASIEDEDALLARIGRINAAAVVLDLGAGPLRTHDHLRHVLAAARCPVLVIGAALGRP